MMPKPPRPVSMELNLAPMVDVMMCLIIFFMLASKLVSAENLELKLPWAVAAKHVEKKELGQRVVINIRPKADGQDADFVVARFAVRPDGEYDITQRVLAPGEVNDFLLSAAKNAADAKEELRCIIRADQTAMYKDVEVVLRGCGFAKIAKIVFSTEVGEEPT